MFATDILGASIQNLPAYLVFLAALLALIAGASAIYKHITPYNEIALIRQSNLAASISFGGFIIGFSIALKSIAAGSGSVVDMAMWGTLALVTQIAAFYVTRFLLPDLKAGIEEGRIAYGVLLGSIAVATGVANAGALTY